MACGGDGAGVIGACGGPGRDGSGGDVLLCHLYFFPFLHLIGISIYVFSCFLFCFVQVVVRLGFASTFKDVKKQLYEIDPLSVRSSVLLRPSVRPSVRTCDRSCVHPFVQLFVRPFISICFVLSCGENRL